MNNKKTYKVKSCFQFSEDYKLIIKPVKNLLIDTEFEKDAEEIYGFLKKVPTGTIRRLEKMIKEKPLLYDKR